MAYDKTIWDENTDVTPARLQNIEDGIEAAHDEITSHKAENATNAHLAKNIGLEDAEGHFEATDVEGALNELFTSVSDGKNLISGAIADVDPEVEIPANPTFQQLANAIGQISTGPTLSSGNTLVLSADTEKSSLSNTYEKMKEIQISYSGIVRVSFDLRSAGGEAVSGRIYVNGIAVGIERSAYSTYTTYTQDIAVNKGDLIQLWIRRSAGGYTASCRNFRIYINPSIFGTIVLN